MKGYGGSVGLTENLATLRCWMVSGPVMPTVIGKVEVTIESKINTGIHY